MPNYKVFQDYADSMRVKIYGVDDSNNTVPLLTNASGKMNVTGTVATSGSVAVSGPVEISGSVAVSGPVAVSGSVYVSGSTVGVSGSVAVSGPVEISGSVAVSGPVAVSGSVYVSGSTVGVSGSVAVSGPVEISGSVAVSGPVAVSGSVYVSGSTVGVSGSVAVSGPVEISGSVAVSGPVGISGSVAVSGTVGVFLSGRGTLDSGPLFDRTSGSDSGALSGVWDVLGFNGWTLAVKYSGTSGDQVSVKLQMAAISGANNWVDDGGYVAFSGTNAYWIFRTPTYHVRYARLYAKNESATASGDFLVYMQGEY